MGQPAREWHRPDQASDAQGDPGRTGADTARTGSRQSYFDSWVETATYDRTLLGAGDVIEGPAVIEEFSSTVPIHPGFSARIDTFGNIRISKSSDSNGVK